MKNCSASNEYISDLGQTESRLEGGLERALGSLHILRYTQLLAVESSKLSDFKALKGLSYAGVQVGCVVCTSLLTIFFK